MNRTYELLRPLGIAGDPTDAERVERVVAALCTYAVAYRFYSRFIATRIFALDAARPTPAVRLNDGRDFTPTNRWIVFGHHFAAIAGPGPLVGPTLAAQFGFLPGAIWIIVGVALGGAVQDFVILCASVRRDGKSLGQMAKEEIGTVAGYTALVAVLGIMIVLLPPSLIFAIAPMMLVLMLVAFLAMQFMISASLAETQPTLLQPAHVPCRHSPRSP